MGDAMRPESEAWKNLDDESRVLRALELAPELYDGDGDEAYWTVIRELHRRGARPIFDEAVRLSVSENPTARRLACEILGQLGYEQGRPFGEETFPVLARLCTEEQSPAVIASAITAMGHVDQAESLALVVAHARDADATVRFAVAFVLPSVAGTDWLSSGHPAVTTLMELTTDDDSDVRDWATFGLGTQVKADGSLLRQCLRARLEDPDSDTREEALAGLVRRHAPEIVRYVQDALGADDVGRLAVESAWRLGDPSLSEALTRLAGWWDVDVDLLEDARRRCDPAVVDATADLVAALLAAAEATHLALDVSSELLPNGDSEPEVHAVEGGASAVYALGPLIRRAAGSVDAAVRLIKEDIERSEPMRATPDRPVTAVSAATTRLLLGQLKNEICELRGWRLPAGLQPEMRSLHMQALQGLHADLDAQLSKPVLVIDGNAFDDLDGFYEEVTLRLIPDAYWGRNLDAFDDILGGGFGTPEEGFVLRWRNATTSRQRLGYEETVLYLEQKLTYCHASNVPLVETEIAAARRGEGPTLFDLIVDIIRSHGPGGTEAEDGVWLELD